MQENNKPWLCRDKYKAVSHIKSTGNKLDYKEYKTWSDWVGKVNNR